ncbi:hypothetical protein Ddye_020742 [Dipteronia dyeriana]|uniref:Uncharacterized protein n=1 Tax=Dipteronia dyeriana TaxID=168575 RepID=A0AAD9U0H6_9ROSI|nr:hypothetical protein Ddye_020742 [Dipteronia dyeriana]
MGIVFREFLGDASQFYKQTGQKFFKIQCCSLDKRDIDYHYRCMSFRYHALGGINDESLRQVYLNSLPTELQGELQRLVEVSNRTLRDISLGEIHMFTHTALDKLCATQRVFAKMIQERKKYYKYCKLPNSYHLKCKIRNIAIAVSPNVPEVNLSGVSPRISHKKKGSSLTTGDIENQKDVNRLTTFMIQDSDGYSSSSETSDYSGPDLPSEVYQATSNENLGPQVQVQILIEKYSKPIPTIAYFDTGAQSTMMNPKVLPPEAWKEENNEFLAADG